MRKRIGVGRKREKYYFFYESYRFVRKISRKELISVKELFDIMAKQYGPYYCFCELENGAMRYKIDLSGLRELVKSGGIALELYGGIGERIKALSEDGLQWLQWLLLKRKPADSIFIISLRGELYAIHPSVWL